MRERTRMVAACLFVSSAWACLPSVALGADPTASIEASGRVDPDGGSPVNAISNQALAEVSPPAMTVSVVNVNDALPNFFSYAAFSDIGLLKLGVRGSLTNDTSGPLGNLEIPILIADAKIKDQLRVTSPAAGTFPVTMTMDVDGILNPNGGQILANSSLFLGLVGSTRGSDFGSYSAGIVNDMLTVTRSIDFAAPGDTALLSFDGRLTLGIYGVPAGATTSGDLSNTASFTLDLGELTLIGSESGTFGVPIPIPEPASYAFMLAGLALIGAAARRRSGG